jgi:hypothetical protein
MTKYKIVRDERYPDYEIVSDDARIFDFEAELTPEEHARIIAAMKEYDNVQSLLDEKYKQSE